MTKRIINLFSGPGTGKSTTAAATFAELKYQGYNTELIPEFAKDATWEGRGKKFFKAQSYIFGCQSFRIDSVIDEVDFLITDSPLLLSLVYIPEDYTKPSLRLLAKEHHDSYESIDIFLERNKPFNPKGRLQNEQEARELDVKIKNMLTENNIPFVTLPFGRQNPLQIIQIMKDRGWIKKSAPHQGWVDNVV